MIGEFAQCFFVEHGAVAGEGIHFVGLHDGVAVVMPIDNQLGLHLPAAKYLLHQPMHHENEQNRHAWRILHQNVIITSSIDQIEKLKDLHEDPDQGIQQIKHLGSLFHSIDNLSVDILQMNLSKELKLSGHGSTFVTYEIDF